MSPEIQKTAARAIAQGTADYLGLSLPVNQSDEVKGVFKDLEAISPWARDSVKLAAEKGLSKGDVGWPEG